MIDRSNRLDARLATLRAVSHALARPLELVEIPRAVHAELSRVLDVSVCFFGLYDAPGQTVEVIWQIHDGTELPGGHFPLGSGLTSQVIRACQPRLSRRWSEEGPRVQVQYATERPGLPESSITVPVVFDQHVIGVLAIQNYRPDAFDDDDLVLVQSIADQMAVAMSAAIRRVTGDGVWPASDLEAILASMSDALLVLDEQGRVVRLNQAARKLLCPPDGSVILGYPVDRAQSGRWPLGTKTLTQQLAPIVDRLRRGDVPNEEFQIAVDGGVDRTVACKASVLMRDGAPAGSLMVLREVTSNHRAA